MSLVPTVAMYPVVDEVEVRALGNLFEKAFTMSTTMTNSRQSFFIVGGTMRPDAPSYMQRQADRDLFEELMNGEFCYVLTARQMGKSSLIIRTAARLRREGMIVAVLDLTALGQNLSAEQWYGSLLVQLGQRLDIEDELMEYWSSQPLLGPTNRWMMALRSVVLPRYPAQLVIFIDEIDAVRSLPFSTDEFFAAMRECYNQRSEDWNMQRLTFCLSGVATPSDLIRDTRTTPFNIGRRIELYDFTVTEATALVGGLERDVQLATSILKRILYWTGGHPYLTQAMCRAISEDSTIRNAKGVDIICEELFLSSQSQKRDDNLLFVKERMLRCEVDPGNLLDLYDRTRRGLKVYDDETSPLVNALRLSGITRTESGRLKVRNRIYAQVFNKRWIMANTLDAEVRRQRKAYWRGVLRASLVSSLILGLFLWITSLAINQRNRAEQEAEARRRLLYFAQMKLAGQAWESANVDRVDEILNSQIPKPGEDDLRGFEWHLLHHLAHGEILRCKEDYPIASLAFLPDNKTLAIGEVLRVGSSGSDEYLIKSYDSESKYEVSSFKVQAGKNFNVITFSPDKRRVAVDSSNYEITLWDIASGRRLTVFTGHKQLIMMIVFSPDGRYLLTSSLDNQVKLWDAANGKQLKTIIMKHWVTSAAFAPDGQTFATTDDSQVVRLWETASGRELPPIETIGEPLVRVSFFPDGKKLLTASQDGLLLILDIRSRQLLTAVTGHTGYMEAFAFSPDGKMLATANDDRLVRVWSTTDIRILYTIRGHGSQVQALAWSSDSKRLATGSTDRTMKVWDVARRELILPEALVASYFATTFSSLDKQLIALGSTRDGQVKLWNLSTGRELGAFGDTGSLIRCATFSRDNKVVAIGKGQVVELWDVATGHLIHPLRGHSSYVRSVEFSPDGKLLISGGEDRALKLWDVIRGQELGSLTSEGSDNHYRAIFSPDGKTIASACRDGSVKLWDVYTKTIIRTFIGHTDRVRAIAFSHNGDRLATGGSDNIVRLWDVASGRELRKLGQSDIINRVAFSLDGGCLVTGGFNNGSIRLWDVATGQELIDLEGHADEVTSITFSEDGKDLATSSSDGTVRFWRGRRNPD
jgi:WD40 repeat protein